MKARFDAMELKRASALMDILGGASVGGTIACLLFLCWQVGSGHL
jgi:hypothetical protein